MIDTCTIDNQDRIKVDELTSLPGPSPDAKRSREPTQLADSIPMILDRTKAETERFPLVGTTILGFELISDLGKGSFGKVFLAKQPQLADRLVALKVTPFEDGDRPMPADEPRHLARMQHANIVPIYSIHRTSTFQIVCMPFLGSVTLSNILAEMRRSGRIPQTAQAFLSTLYSRHTTVPGISKPSEKSPPNVAPDAELKKSTSPILERLSHSNHVETVVWIVARLAEGLQHAHERDILHLDLKPANILLTDDGQPMLLDFNVSIEMAPESLSKHKFIGGTLSYMSPEHIRAMRNRNLAVDARSDLYSLGVIMYEMLTVQPAFPDRTTNHGPATDEMIRDRELMAPSARKANPAVPHAVSSIVAKLLDPNPAWRYQTAAELHEDLERQLKNRPLRYASDRSPRERFRKWRRRCPRFSTACLVGLAALFILVLPVAAITVRQNQMEERQKEIAERQKLSEIATAKQTWHETGKEARTVQVLLATLSGDRDLLNRGMSRGKSVVDRYAIDRDPNWMEQPLFGLLPRDQQTRLRTEMAEMLLLMARAETIRAGDARDAETRREQFRTALHWNQLAQQCYLPDAIPLAHSRQLRELLQALPEEAVRIYLPNVSSTTSEFDPYHDGIASAIAGKYTEALGSLYPFAEKHPQHFSAWFVRGHCHEALGQYADSAACWGICIALEPDMPWAYFNRATVRLRQANFKGADADLSRALQLQPDWQAALMNRAIARKEMKEYASARADLDQVLLLDGAPSRAWFLRGEVNRLAGDRDAAGRDRAEGLKREPNDELSWSTRGFYRMSEDPRAALKDFDAALALNPRSRDALINKSIVFSKYLKCPKDAVAVLDRLLEYYPDLISARAGRGVVLARIGESRRAREDAEECLRRDRSGFMLFQMGGLYAQLCLHEKATDAKDEALRLLGASLRGGFSDLTTWKGDHDLDPVREQTEFKRLEGILVGLKNSVRQ